MIKNRKNVFFALTLLCTATLSFAKIQPLPEVVKAREEKAKLIEAQKPDTSKFIFFEENLVAGGYSYVYGGNTRVFIPEESGHTGDVSVCFELDPADYSGGAVVLYSSEYNLTDVFATGALEFWIKGETGGEIGEIGLSDNEMVDGLKTEVTVNFDKYGGIKPYWTHMSIPLADFGRRGGYWNERLQTTIKNNFKWGNVKEFIVVTSKGANKKFKIWLDNVYIVKDRYAEPKNLWDPYWDEIVEVIEPAPARPGAEVKEVVMHYEKDFDTPMKADAYGGRTVFSQKNTTDSVTSPHVLGIYLDNTEYSGVGIQWGKNTDYTALRNSGGGIGFWAKAVEGVTEIFFGLTDNKGDGKNVSSGVLLSDFGKIDTTWQYFMIPLKEFSDDGDYWDENTNSNKPGPMDWSKIIGMQVTSGKYVNRIPVEDPIKLFLSRIALIDKVPGYVDPDIYWDNFNSSAPDVMVIDFEKNAVSEEWMAISGESSMLEVKILSQSNRDLRDKYGRWYLALDWSINDWAMANYGVGRRNLPAEICNWSKHSAIAFDAFSNRDKEQVIVKISDEFKEEWMALVTLKSGWNEVVVPFRKFRKSSYQSSEAGVNGKLDLNRVWEFGFHPSEVGVSSQTLFDNIRLTQEPKGKK